MRETKGMMMDTETVVALVSLFGPVGVISVFVGAVLHSAKDHDHDETDETDETGKGADTVPVTNYVNRGSW